MRRAIARGERRSAPGRGLRRGAARRGDGARHALLARLGQRPETPGGRPRCLDARHGAAAHLPRAGVVGRPGSRAGAAAAAQRFALRARQSAAVGGHAAAAQLEIRSAGATAFAASGRAIDFGRAVGEAAAAAFPDRIAGIHPRRTHRAESGNIGEGRGKARTGCHHPAGVPTVVGGGRGSRGGPRQRIGKQCDPEATARPGGPANEGLVRIRRGPLLRGSAGRFAE